MTGQDAILIGLFQNTDFGIPGVDDMTGKRAPVSLQSDSDSADSSKYHEENVLPADELNERFNDITKSIERLANVVSPVRAATTKGRDILGAVYDEREDGANKSELFEKFVEDLLELRCRNVRPHLRGRLKKGIAQRRRQYTYQLCHQQKMILHGDSQPQDLHGSRLDLAVPATLIHSTSNINPSCLQPTRAPP